ncbi:MAG TPA: hypothetical protein PLY90_07945 [Candidatus Hydrogenedentes bacterium]|jgi:hypothetical protein|nr:MAG: hypothetical protein BWY07_02469 [Candidatus Hydrogenedentes bacterium ADurb.Bin170]HOD96346.1 hypothetical protein [Candidatus Hydrogenedentota bacterium]HOR51767.1 hypothetical protein [Candidatus Hydrogenedentota bacterium]HPK25769.1 hypothetical protein [Candidatus Hydrogenedentota bacterium]HPX87366.1 hypothetical protein [Candidatus Hydrogenedentota bacterium]
MSQSKTRIVPLLLLLVVLALIGGSFYGYLAWEKAKFEGSLPAEKKVAAPTTPQPAERPKPSAVRSFGELSEPPLTLSALRFLPAQADIALGIPPIASLLANGVPLAQDILKDRLDLQAEIQSIAQGIALEMGLSEDKDMAAVLTDLGIDIQSGAAVFLTAKDMVTGALAAETPPKLSKLFDMPGFSLTIALPVLNGEQAEENILKFLSNLLTGIEVTEEQVAGLTLKKYEDHAAYFVTPTMFVISNNMDVLKSAAERAADPAVFQYGTTDCPPEFTDEGVMLLFVNRLMPLLDSAEQEMKELGPLADALSGVQMDQMKAMCEDSKDTEPIVVSWHANKESAALKSKISTLAYPVVAVSQGDGKAAVWSQRLPRNTMAFLSLILNDAIKKRIVEDYIGAIPEEVLKQSKASKGMQYLPNVMQLLGGEVTLGLTGLDPLDAPSIFLIIELASAPTAQMFLGMAPQQDSGEPYKGIQIKQLTIPAPMPVYFALVESALILTNSDEGLKSFIDQAQSGTTSGFYDAVTPPLDANALIYHSFYLNPDFYTEVVEPMASLIGMTLPEKYTDVAEEAARIVRDIRAGTSQDGEWLTGKLEIILKPAADGGEAGNETPADTPDPDAAASDEADA